MNVLVIGGTRFLGWYIARELLRNGHEVTLLHRTPPGEKIQADSAEFSFALPGVMRNRTIRPPPLPGVRHIIGDRLDPRVISSAARTGFDAVVDLLLFRERDAEVCVRAFSRTRLRHYLFISTVAEYPTHLRGPEPLREEILSDPPLDAYGRGKHEVRQCLEAAWHDLQFPVTTIIINAAYGPFDPVFSLLPLVARLWKEEAIYLDEASLKRPLQDNYIGNIAAATVAVLGVREALGRVVNAAGSEYLNAHMALHAIAAGLERDAKVIEVSKEVDDRLVPTIGTRRVLDPFGNQHSLRLDVGSLLNLTKLCFPYRALDGLADTAQWVRVHHSLLDLDGAGAEYERQVNEVGGQTIRRHSVAGLIRRPGREPENRLPIGEVCNNHCVPCVGSAGATDLGTALQQSAAPGRRILLCGREPTLAVWLPTLIRELRSRGWAEVELESNGRRFAYLAYTRELATAGLTHTRIKVPFFDAQSFDAHTGIPGSFTQTCTGIENLAICGIAISLLTPEERPHGRVAELIARREHVSVAVPTPRECESDRPQAHRARAATLNQSRIEITEACDRIPARLLDDRLRHLVAVRTPDAAVGLGNQCNQDCLYCELFRHKCDRPALQVLVHRIEAIVRHGFSHISIKGGEPTTSPQLLPCVYSSRAKGIRGIELLTNGVNFSNSDLAEHLREAGITELQLSLDDHRPEVNATLTRNPKYLRHQDDLLRNALQPSWDMMLFRVFTRHNLDATDAYLDYVRNLEQRFGRQISVVLALLKPVGHAWIHAQDVLVDPRAAAGAVAKVLENASRAGLIVTTQSIPPCMLPSAATAPIELYCRLGTIDLVTGERAIASPVGRAHRPVCSGCVISRMCSGFLTRYEEIFGFGVYRHALPSALCAS